MIPERHHRFLVENRASIWLIFLSVCLTATMMHPTGASVITMAINLAILFLLRMVAHIEGKHG